MSTHTAAGIMEDRYSSAEIMFLGEQLAALIEVRDSGHYSDIVSVARSGLQSARRLRRRVEGKEARSVDTLVTSYAKLVMSIVH